MEQQKKIKIIHLENNGIDAELVNLALKDQPYLAEITVVDERNEFCRKLDTDAFDLIFMDYDVPTLGAIEAITIIQQKKIKAPIIIISGAIGYQTAIQLIKQGAFDYVLRQNLVALPDTISRALADSNKKPDDPSSELNQVIKATRTGVFRMDSEGNCLFVNEPLCEMLGYSKEELENKGWVNCLAEENKADFLTSFNKQLQSLTPFEVRAKLITKASEELWVRCNCIPETTTDKPEFIGAITDISNLKKTEDELIALSMHDALTGLPNRRYFTEAVQTMVSECERGLLDAFSVFYIDLDRFKTINDVLGHQCGDELLKQAANRFKSAIRKYDIIARIGGDEFLIVFKHIGSIGEIAFLADNLLNKFRVPFYINDQECLTTLSIGATYIHEPVNHIDAGSIIQKADQALYRAKARGRNCYELYREEISHEILHTAFIENALRHAIERKEFYIVFQPQVNALKNQLYGFEVLLRWKQSVYGDISPAIFIPISEETGQINEIGRWVFDTGLKAFNRLSENINYFKRYPITFSINVSPKQLLEDEFINHSLKQMALQGIDFKKITFELTETSLIQNIERLKNQFNRMKTGELNFAVDDFGTGYSSFTNLKELPIKIIKIDQSFVQLIEAEVNCQNIIKSIIALAKTMGITLIAEGVETKAQVDFLMENGCYILQGYYFSKPLLEEQISGYIESFNG